jgi:hypothetical protein
VPSFDAHRLAHPPHVGQQLGPLAHVVQGVLSLSLVGQILVILPRLADSHELTGVDVGYEQGVVMGQ